MRLDKRSKSMSGGVLVAENERDATEVASGGVCVCICGCCCCRCRCVDETVHSSRSARISFCKAHESWR